MTKIKNFLSSTWELPQNLLGRIVKKVCKAEFYMNYETSTVYSWKIPGGMSLGNYIFIPFWQGQTTRQNPMEYIKHEYGHSIQSHYLGWFYLLVIGLPSLVWAQCFEWYRQKFNVSYYSFYTEKWANKLGGVNKENEQ